MITSRSGTKGRAPRARRTRRRVRGRKARQRRRDPTGGARSHLRVFRQATILAVAITSFLLLLLAPAEEAPAAVQEGGAPAQVEEREIPDTVSIIEPVPVEELQPDDPADDPDEALQDATREARETLEELWVGLVSNLPKILIAIAILFLAWLATKVTRPVVRRVTRGWERANALGVLLSLSIWLLALGIAVSVIAGDIRALIGSIGLIGLALSWALQTPIESFTGWLLNSSRGYYRVGDRIAVGEVFGDVYRIDALTTTVWEYGGPDRAGGGMVTAEQPTGRMITFPNNEVLAGSIVNYTRDFPYVWDELTVPVGNRSDLDYAMGVLKRIADEVVGEMMRDPAGAYEDLLQRSRLETEVAREPEIFVSLDDSWTNLTIRYLVAARERRRWNSRLAKAVMGEINRDEHQEKIRSVVPRRQIQMIDAEGRAVHPYVDESSPDGPDA